MKMYEYKLVSVKNEFIDIVNNNPNTLKLLYVESNDGYFQNLKINIFNKINKDIIILFFNEHMSYNELENIYYLNNDFTNEIITIRFEDYCIYVKESNDNLMFYMNICKKIGGFYIIK